MGSDEHVGIPACTRDMRSRTSIETQTEGDRRVTTYRTPFGMTQTVRRFDVVSQAWHPIVFPIRDLETLKLMTAFFEDTDVVLDEARLSEARARVREVGDNGFTFMSIGESPLMVFVEWLAGIEQAHYLLADHPDEVKRLFGAIHRTLLEKAALMAKHSPTDVLYMVENTSTTLISPAQYRRYCLPHITAYGETVHRYGRKLFLHMCGKLKRLLPDLATLPAEAFEAFTAPPLGSTTLLDGRTHCPDTCLVGGTHAMLWTRTAEEIIAEIKKSLDALPHHRGVVVTSAGVMPPLCAPETIKAVCEWVQSYPARL
jgi:uroporphyrinogen-III decarboxylase